MPFGASGGARLLLVHVKCIQKGKSMRTALVGLLIFAEEKVSCSFSWRERTFFFLPARSSWERIYRVVVEIFKGKVVDRGKGGVCSIWETSEGGSFSVGLGMGEKRAL